MGGGPWARAAHRRGHKTTTLAKTLPPHTAATTTTPLPSSSEPQLGQALEDLHLGARVVGPNPRSPFGGTPPASAPPPAPTAGAASAPARLTRRAAAAARASASASSSEAEEVGGGVSGGASRTSRLKPSESDASAVVPPTQPSPTRKPREASLAALAADASTSVPGDARAGGHVVAPTEPTPPPPDVPRAPTSHLTVAAPDASPTDQAVGIVYDPGMEAHTPPGPHVERPARTATLAALLAATGLTSRCRTISPRAAADGELLRLHSTDHVAAVDAAYGDRGSPFEEGDMFYSAATAHAARLAAGCVTQAVLAVLAGEARRSFAVVRPPGHHAHCARARGFCFFNNVALAAVAARAAGAARVLVVDFDVHHGDGIQALTYDRDDIMYVSLHRGGGFYPGTGTPIETGVGAGAGRNLNVAWTRGGLGDAEYEAAFDLVVLPAARAFAPDLVIVAAGFDAAAGDPLGGMLVSPSGFASMTAKLLTLAGGRMAMALEGGYNVDKTAACAAACVDVLLTARADATGGGDTADSGSIAPSPKAAPSRDAAPAIAAAATALAPHWPGALGPIADAAGFNRAWRDYCLAAKSAGADRRVTRSARGVADTGSSKSL